MLHLLSLLLPSAVNRSVDALTGLASRRGLQAQIERDKARLLSCNGRPLSVALFDLDRFRRVNDILGRAMGDAVLAGFGACLREHCRTGDLAARWGGEEFLLLMPATPLADAVAIAERLRQAVASRFLAELAPRVTVSAGIAQAPAAAEGQAFSLPALIQLAEARLYAAKASRNCVRGDDEAGPAMPPMPAGQTRAAAASAAAERQASQAAVTRR